MRFDCARVAIRVQALLSRFGQDAIWIDRTDGEYDASFAAPVGPNPPSVAHESASVTERPVVLVVMNYDRSEIDGTRVLASDFRIYMDGISGEPKVGDALRLSSGLCEIISVQTLSPGGVVALYEIQARK